MAFLRDVVKFFLCQDEKSVLVVNVVLFKDLDVCLHLGRWKACFLCNLAHSLVYLRLWSLSGAVLLHLVSEEIIPAGLLSHDATAAEAAKDGECEEHYATQDHHQR